MKIIKLIAENVKKLKAVEINPKGNIIKISGENEAGKSSVLDSIFYALCWKEASKEVKRPIRDGQSEAQVQVFLQKDEDDNWNLVEPSQVEEVGDIQKIIVTRKWSSNDKTYLKIETEDGFKFSSPQLLLDTLVEELSYDPFRFIRMSPKEQIDKMFKLIKFEQDPRVLDEKRAEIYQERTLVNRESAKLEGQLDGFKPEIPDDNYPAKEVTSESILVKLREAREKQNENDNLRNSLQAKLKDFQTKRTEIQEMENQITELQNKLKVKIEECRELSKDGIVLKKTVSELKDPDIEGIENQLQKVEEHNKRYELKKKYETVKTEYKESVKRSTVLSDAIKKIDDKKEEIMSSIKFPIKGLNFDEYGVTYQSIPLQQCSRTQQLKIAIAIGISMKPKLRIIRILDGALLTEKNMSVIEEMAENKDFQVWIEVASDEKIGIHIVDGEVESRNDVQADDAVDKFVNEVVADEEEAMEYAESEAPSSGFPVDMNKFNFKQKEDVKEKKTRK